MNTKLQHKDVRMTPVYSDDGDGDNENESGSENEQEDNEDDNDADNDEAEPEEEGGKNGHKASSDEEESSEEEGSGSEDSSDMDVEECEKKRFEFLGDLTELEGQFAILREQLYRERLRYRARRWYIDERSQKNGRTLCGKQFIGQQCIQ